MIFHRFERYRVLHELEKHTHGRVYEHPEIQFETYFQLNEFDLLLDRERDLIICKSAKRIAKNLIDTLNDACRHDFRADYYETDFNVLWPKIADLRGVWLAEMKVAHVHAVALFGTHVDRSDMYRQAEALGTASAVLIHFPWAGRSEQVIITKSGSIVFASKMGDAEYMDLLQELKADLLDDALRYVDSKQTKKEKKEAR